MFNSKFGVGVLKHPGYNDIFSAAASIFGSSEQADAAKKAATEAAKQQAADKARLDDIKATSQISRLK